MPSPIPINAPQGTIPAHGLIASALTSPAELPGENPPRWENGFTFTPETCDEPESWIIPCVGTGSTGGPGAAITEKRDDVGNALTWTPYVIRASYKCTAQQAQAIDFQQRAQRIFELGESKLMESELYRGDAAGRQRQIDDPGFNDPNLSLTSIDIANPAQNLGSAVGGSTTPTLGIRTLLQAAAAAPGGQRAMLHATPAVAMAWMQSDSIYRSRDGGLRTTIGEHIVVVGSGYEGFGPDNTTTTGTTVHWAWVTSPVYTLKGVVDVIPPVMDRAANDLEVIVQRTACAYWDGCLHAGVPIETMGTIV